MIDLRIRKCNYKNNIKEYYFNLINQNKDLFCSELQREGLKDLKQRKSDFENCLKIYSSY